MSHESVIISQAAEVTVIRSAPGSDTILQSVAKPQQLVSQGQGPQGLAGTQIHVGTTPPINPSVGALWVDTN